MHKQPFGNDTTTQCEEQEQWPNTYTTGEQPSPEDPITRERKYKAFWVVFLVVLALLLWGKLDGDQFVELTYVIYGLYVAGNVGEHWTRRQGNWRRGRR